MSRKLRAGYEKLAFSVEETAELLSISRSQLYRLIDLGELSTVKIGECRRITKGQLEGFLERLERTGGTPPLS